MNQVYMTVSGKHTRKYLSNKRATEGAEHLQPLLSSSSKKDDGGSTPLLAAAKRHVAAASKLLPLPWDAALGYGNPKREVRISCATTIYKTISKVESWNVGAEAHLLVFCLPRSPSLIEHVSF